MQPEDLWEAIDFEQTEARVGAWLSGNNGLPSVRSTEQRCNDYTYKHWKSTEQESLFGPVPARKDMRRSDRRRYLKRRTRMFWEHMAAKALLVARDECLEIHAYHNNATLKGSGHWMIEPQTTALLEKLGHPAGRGPVNATNCGRLIRAICDALETPKEKT